MCQGYPRKYFNMRIFNNLARDLATWIWQQATTESVLLCLLFTTYIRCKSMQPTYSIRSRGLLELPRRRGQTLFVQVHYRFHYVAIIIITCTTVRRTKTNKDIAQDGTTCWQGPGLFDREPCWLSVSHCHAAHSWLFQCRALSGAARCKRVIWHLTRTLVDGI